jgi:hypothetical protein
MDAADYARFETTLGYPLPKQMLEIGSVPPYLESDVDRLIELNRRVRLPGTPWIGPDAEPWPEDHVVIGDDGCGNYWSVLRVDRHRNKSVWFYDHDVATLERQHKNVAAFLTDKTVLAEVELVPYVSETESELYVAGEWKLAAQQSIGPIHFGMTRHEVRTLLDQPYSVVSRPDASDEPSDAFETMDLCVHYHRNKCVAVDCLNPGNVSIGAHQLADESFAAMATILADHVTPDVVTPTSFQSIAFGVEFRIERPSLADEIGAITWLQTSGPGYLANRLSA